MATPPGRWPAPPAVDALLAHRRGRPAARPRDESDPSRPPGGRPSPGHPPRPSGRGAGRPANAGFVPAAALRAVAGAAAVTSKNARDLPRALAETPPSPAQAADLAARLRVLDAAAARLAAVLRARGHDPAAGPSRVPGTYVVVYRLGRARPGTADRRPGHVRLPGRVLRVPRQRVRRRRGAGPDRPAPDPGVGPAAKWNVDHLKPLCMPVEVWWTHDRRAVEFDWAKACLAGLHGGVVPRAAGFGAADNPAAAAHLVRFDRVPIVPGVRRSGSS